MASTLLAAPVARAQHENAGVRTAAARAEAVELARPYFERALALYRAGDYEAAHAQLEHAVAIDPTGKDLWFNMHLVQEKLERLDDAIDSLERVIELESDPAEQERARLTIRRLQGARARQREHAPQIVKVSSPCPEAATPARRPAAGDALVIGAASLSGASLVLGVIFGLKALSEDPGEARTSRELSLDALRERRRRAARDALVADVAFAVALGAGGTAVGILLTRSDSRQRGAVVQWSGAF